MAARYHTSAAVQPDRGQVLQEGRDAAIARRRADSQRCRDRVAEVIEMMRRTRTPLSDTEITRRARAPPGLGNSPRRTPNSPCSRARHLRRRARRAPVRCWRDRRASAW
jgi:hypothetical protein